MNCSNCGTELEENAKFCPKCGMAVSIQPNENAIQKEQRNDASAKKPLMKHPGFIFLAIAVVLIIVLGIIIFGFWSLYCSIPMIVVAAAAIAVFRIILRKRRRKGSQEIAQCVLADSDINKFSQYFVNKDETYVSSLGNGYLMNFLASGNLRRGFAVISNKRVYFRGSCFSGSGKLLVKTDEERTVDVKDITGSGFLYRRYIGILLGLFTALAVLIAGSACSIVMMYYSLSSVNEELWSLDAVDSGIASYEAKINEDDSYIRELEMQGEGDSYDAAEARENRDYCIKELERCRERRRDVEYQLHRNTFQSLGCSALVSVVISFLISCFLIFLNYLRKRKTLFQIQYAGGSIAFDVSYYAKAEIDDFQKQLRRIKDLAAESAEKIAAAAPSNQAAAQSPAPASVPDDLRKYAELLKDGLISQEEYDAVKKKTLGL